MGTSAVAAAALGVVREAVTRPPPQRLALARALRRRAAVALVPAFAASSALASSTAVAAEIVIQPGDDFCGAFNGAAAGDAILLAPGDHPGPCVLSQGGAPGSPKVLRAQDPEQPAAIVYAGDSSNVIDVTTSHVVIADLEFGPTGDGIDAIKIKSGDDVRIEGSHFFQIGGISISANSVDTQGVAIVGNFFEDLHATGIYLGCHDGMSACAARDYLIEGNLIDGVDSAAVGYGLEVKLDSHGVVRDNVIHDTKGPGIEIYGSTDLARGNLVDGNLVIGSRESGTLEIAGGPTVARSNIVVGGATAGLYVYDYGDRGLVRAIQIVGNTVVGDAGPAVLLSKWAADKDLELTSNAVWQQAGGGPALPAPIPGVPMEGDVECVDPGACWIDGAARDLAARRRAADRRRRGADLGDPRGRLLPPGPELAAAGRRPRCGPARRAPGPCRSTSRTRSRAPTGPEAPRPAARPRAGRRPGRRPGRPRPAEGPRPARAPAPPAKAPATGARRRPAARAPARDRPGTRAARPRRPAATRSTGAVARAAPGADPAARSGRSSSSSSRPYDVVVNLTSVSDERRAWARAAKADTTGRHGHHRHSPRP
ncbi:MAG: right-handed parallel beta-helix repeat-containing protein [Nannocystaceae bacterium]